MKIVIPSHNRCNSVITLHSIPKKYLKDTYIVVRNKEQQKLYSHYSCNILILDCNNISTKRDAICRHFENQKIWMVDDDCKLYNTKVVDCIHSSGNHYNKIKLIEPVKEKEFDEFISYTNNLLDKYPHGMVRPNIFMRGKNYYPYRLNTWAFTNVFLNLKIVDADCLDYNSQSTLKIWLLF